MYTGGFSAVFPYRTINGEKWAFRCWHAEIKNSQQRYETISNAIRTAQLEFLCEFEYIEKGIIVEGDICPITRMRWIEGFTLKDYICQNRNSKKLLKSLAENFLNMTRVLHEHSFAHGDLQHGNILVNKKGKLYLVDYDSFYCPAIKGEPDTITGLPDYQHPVRKHNKLVSEKLDYFSELVIYLSILAIAENPSFIDKYSVEGADRLLFSQNDFKDIRQSQIYADINALGKEFQNLLGVLEDYLKCDDINELLPFESLLFEKQIAFTTSATKVVRNTQTVVIEWDVPFSADVYIRKDGNIEQQKCDKKGQIKTTLVKDTSFELFVKSKDGRSAKKSILIKVFDECKMDFSVDKRYIFPSIPVRLMWNVKNARIVWLNGEQVEATGSKIIEPEKPTICVLAAEDEFGKKEKQIEIGMLPIPQVKTLLVPTPQLVNNMSIMVQRPKLNLDVKIPKIDIGFVKTEIPQVPSLTDLELNADLLSSIPKWSTKGFNFIKRRK